MKEIHLSEKQYFEAEKISLGAYYPLTGFMKEDEFISVVNDMILPNGSVFSIPIVLDIAKDYAVGLVKDTVVKLMYESKEIGYLKVESVFRCSRGEVAKKIYGTSDKKHAGVRAFYEMKEMFVGGEVTLKERTPFNTLTREMTPEETKALFKEKKWKTVVAFHTRNPPHRAHECLQRMVFQSYDGLFIHPIIGGVKPGEFLPNAIMEGYKTLVSKFYPPDRVVLSGLKTFGRYAGPREAVFHALVRRNYGCTHIIIGRDHAGVENYYGKYDSQELCRKFEGVLGIKIIKPRETYYCGLCGGTVTDNICPHGETDEIEEISGTNIRILLESGKRPPKHVMRPEVIDAFDGNEMFVQ